MKLGTDQDLLEILGVNFYSLKKASDQILKNNPSDLKAGVIEVYFNHDSYFFDHFDSLVYKVYRPGSELKRQCFFYCTMLNPESIFSISKRFEETLGTPNSIGRKSICDKSSIENVARGKVSSSFDDCIGKWQLNSKYQVWLQYLVSPAMQFAFHIDEI